MAEALWVLAVSAVISLLICVGTYFGNRYVDRKLTVDFRSWDPNAPIVLRKRAPVDRISFAAKAVGFVAGIGILLICIHVALGQPALGHEGDTHLDDWYRSLRIPGTQTSCCDKSDCAPVPYRITVEGYEVQINGEWMKVPSTAIIQQLTNPTGEAVACYLPHRGIMCFVRPSEA